jgi:hypothetical protein
MGGNDSRPSLIGGGDRYTEELWEEGDDTAVYVRMRCLDQHHRDSIIIFPDINLKWIQ